MEQQQKIESPNMVWAFSQADIDTKPLLVESLKNGKSRFGWSSKDEHNIMNDWSEYHSQQLFLRHIKVGDWIVHINTPNWSECMAAKVISEYQYDEGFGKGDYGYERVDFRHCFEVDEESVIIFKRNSHSISPKVNLKPRSRYHRVYATKEFAESIESLINSDSEEIRGRREDHFLKKETEEKIIPKLSELISQMNRGKELEVFLSDCFNNIPYVKVKKNGFGWKTDNGADLLLNIKDALEINDYLAVVQVKSYRGKVVDETAIKNIKTAFKKFNPEVGIIMTTGEPTDEFISSVDKLTKELQEEKLLSEGKDIILIAGNEFAKFVLRHAPEKLFNI